MKKSVFTLLAIATMVVSMSSCSQNDGGNSNDLNLQTTQTTTQANTTEDVSFMVCATPEQLECIDMQFVVNVDGQEKTINVSQMTELTDKSKYENVGIYKDMKELNTAFKSIDTPTTLKVFSIDFGQNTGNCEIKSVKWTPKADHTTTDEISIANAFGFYTSKPNFNSKTNTAIYKGIATDDNSLTSFCNTVKPSDGCTIR